MTSPALYDREPREATAWSATPALEQTAAWPEPVEAPQLPAPELQGGRVARALESLSRALDWLAERVVLFRWREFVFVSFGLFAGAGAFVATGWMSLLLVGWGLPARLFPLLALAGGLAMVLGAWLFGVALDHRLLRRRPLEVLRRPAFVSWGGLVGLGLVIGAFSNLSGFSVLLILDALACSAPLGHALGRIGCLSYGCCFGVPTAGPLAVTYRNPESKAVRVGGLSGVRIHPSALYEALLDLAIFLAVNGVALLGAARGVPIALSMILYGVGRFAIEFSKSNQGRMLVGPLSVNHAMSLGFAAVGALAIWPAAATAAASPAVAWSAALGATPALLPIFALVALVVFLGFSTHRGRVGAW